MNHKYSFEKQIYGVETLGQKEMINTAKKLADKVVYAIPKKLTTEEFTRKYEEKYNQVPSFSVDTAYDNLMLIVKAIEECGTDGEKIKSCLHNIGQNYKGVSGTITFDENGDIDKPFSLYQFVGKTSVEINT